MSDPTDTDSPHADATTPQADAATPPADGITPQTEANRPHSAADATRADILRRINAAFADRVPVVNSVRIAALSAPPDPVEMGLAPVGPSLAYDAPAPVHVPLTPRAARRAQNRAQRRARRLQRRAEKLRRDPAARIDFTDWVAVPWQTRPVEARLADVARQIGEQIAQSPAWRHDLLDTQRLRLDPIREASDTALAAYRLYRQRAALGPRPVGAASPVLARAQALFDEHFDGLRQAWLSLVDRTATMDSYRRHLAALAPILSAQQAVDRLSDTRLDEDMSAVYTDAARNELIASDTRDLTDRVDGIGAALTEVLARIDADLRELAAGPSGAAAE